VILTRYFTREIAGTTAAVTFILLLIFLANQSVRYLAAVAGGRYALSIVLKLLATEVPHLATLLLPLGLYLGILLVVGRMQAQNEWVALRACGASARKIFYFSFPMIASMTVLVACMSLWLGPSIAYYRDVLLQQTATDGDVNTMVPGQFNATRDGKRVFYVEAISNDRKQLRNIFVAEEVNPSEGDKQATWSILSSASGVQKLDAQTQSMFVVSQDGHRYQGVAGQSDFSIIDYGDYAVRIRAKLPGLIADQDAMPTKALWRLRHQKPLFQAELQWRMALPISVFLLGFLALVLPKSDRQSGRYAKLFPALLIYIIYANFLFITRAWIEEGKGNSMYWVHLALLVLFFGLLAMEHPYWLRAKRRLTQRLRTFL